MIGFLDVAFKIGDGPISYIQEAAYTVCLLLDVIIYSVLNLIYQIFFMVSEINLFDNDSATSAITERIYVVLGIVMLFVFAYNIILMIINPDKLSSKDNGISKIVKDTVISIVLIALLPTIFNIMYNVQYRVLETNVIGNIILGGANLETVDGVTQTSKQKLRNAGIKTSTTIFTTFFHPVIEQDGQIVDLSLMQCRNNPELSLCSTYVDAYDEANDSHNVYYFMDNKQLVEGIVDGDMRYMWIISSVCGLIAIYLFFSFTFDIGIRAVKLAVLQLIAPIPIMLRITKPTGGVFSKWFKEIKETYISLFVRLAIVYFAMFSIDLVWKSHDWFSIYDEYGFGILSSIAQLILVLSILAFAKEAPKLIQNIMGGVGNVEWNLRKKLGGDNYEYGRRLTTSLAAGTSNLVHGKNAFSGLKTGWKNGNFNLNNGWGAARRQIAGVTSTKSWSATGSSKAAGIIDRPLNYYSKNVDKINAARDKAIDDLRKKRASGKIFDEALDNKRNSISQSYDSQINDATKQYNAANAQYSADLQKEEMALKTNLSKVDAMVQADKEKAKMAYERTRDEIIRKYTVDGKFDPNDIKYKKAMSIAETKYQNQTMSIDSNYSSLRNKLQQQYQDKKTEYQTKVSQLESDYNRKISDLNAQKNTALANVALSHDERAAIIKQNEQEISSISENARVQVAHQREINANKDGQSMFKDTAREIKELEVELNKLSQDELSKVLKYKNEYGVEQAIDKEALYASWRSGNLDSDGFLQLGDLKGNLEQVKNAANARIRYEEEKKAEKDKK